jgi:hypothetical protein
MRSFVKAPEWRHLEHRHLVLDFGTLVDVQRLIAILTTEVTGTCPTCGGSGQVWDTATNYAELKPCPACNNGQRVGRTWGDLAEDLLNAEVPKA